MNTRARVRPTRALSLLALLATLFIAPLSLARADSDRAAAETRQERVQPGNNEPFWLDVQSGLLGRTPAVTIDAGVLENPAGEVWRQLHEGPFPFWGALWLVGVPSAILAFWFIFGSQRLHGEESGRLIRRFAAWERSLHWTTTIMPPSSALEKYSAYSCRYG